MTARRIGQELVLHIVGHLEAEPWSAAILQLVCASFGGDDLSSFAPNECEASVLDTLVGFSSLEDCTFLLVEHAIPARAGQPYVPHDSGALVAFAVVARYTRALYIANLCTHPSARGRGVASTLLYECHDLAYELGLEALCGTVAGERSDLRGFYGALGASLVADCALGSAGAPRNMRLIRPVRPAEVGVRGAPARQGPRSLRRVQAPIRPPMGPADAVDVWRAEPAHSTFVGCAAPLAGWLRGCAGRLLPSALRGGSRPGGQASASSRVRVVASAALAIVVAQVVKLTLRRGTHRTRSEL